MLELNFHPFPVITTERLILRQVTDDDANEIFFLRSDEGVMKYIKRTPAASVEDAIKWIQMIDANISNNESINWGITLKDDPVVIGNICLFNVQKDHFRAELGYALYPSHHGKGLMQEAIRAVLDYGFKTMMLHSISAYIDPENIASAKVLERNGFIREAYFKEDYFYDGAFYDTAVYSLITRLK